MVSKIFPFHVCATSHTKQKAKHIHTKQNSFTIQNKKKTGPILIFSPPPPGHKPSLQPLAVPSRPGSGPPPPAACHSRMVWSSAPESRYRPRGERSAHTTGRPWPRCREPMVIQNLRPSHAKSHAWSSPVTHRVTSSHARPHPFHRILPAASRRRSSPPATRPGCGEGGVGASDFGRDSHVIVD